MDNDIKTKILALGLSLFVIFIFAMFFVFLTILPVKAVYIIFGILAFILILIPLYDEAYKLLKQKNIKSE
ncbi:MAG: hypothetical protein WCX60_06600 [Anaerovoracaceae bacterium]